MGLGVTVTVVPLDHELAAYLGRNLFFPACGTLGSSSWSCILTRGMMYSWSLMYASTGL